MKVLVVQEKHCSPGTLGLWKIPTGFILEVIFFNALQMKYKDQIIDAVEWLSHFCNSIST